MNKTLLVTGASSDIGVSLIKQLANNYDSIIIHYRTPSEMVEELQMEYGNKLIPFQADLLDLGQTQKLATIVKSQKVDHFVHLPAAATLNVRFAKAKWELFQEEIDISLRSAVLLSQACLQNMTKQKYGKIVFMLTSYLTSDPPPAYLSAYIMVKYGLLGLMKSLSAEYATKGITVNGVSPSMMDTKFLKEVPAIVKELNAQKNPLKRNLVPGDVVPAIEFLLSCGADTITGQNIAVTAGS